MGKKLQLILAALVLGVMLAACGNNSSSGNSSVEVIDNPSGEEREIVILGSNFEFDQDEYTVAVGEAVKLVYRNAEGSHGIAVEDTDIKLRTTRRSWSDSPKPVRSRSSATSIAAQAIQA